MKRLLFCTVLWVTSFSVVAQAPTCDNTVYRQFDFWVGEWDVYTAQGQIAGKNTISKQLGNCILKEDYSTPSGYTGQSFNIYDRISGQWHQTWVDNTGLLLSLYGQLEGNAMVLQGKGKNPQGQDILHRITWTPVPDGSVRQHWESSTDEGKSWSTLFDGKYVKRK
ncbi:MAG: hypothetical protein Alis3KO_13600 [Aliiglaciecola sp.]